jgi:hypothetical protein
MGEIMTTTAPQETSTDSASGGTPSVYHLHGKGVQITFYPTGAGPATRCGLVKLVYQDAHGVHTFHEMNVGVQEVRGLGLLVSATVQDTPDLGSTTATVVIPKVVLGSAHSARVRTVLITTLHSSPLTGIIPPQADSYTVTKLRGSASVQILPG